MSRHMKMNPSSFSKMRQRGWKKSKLKRADRTRKQKEEAKGINNK